MFQAGTFFLLTVSILQPRSMKLANVNVAKRDTISILMPSSKSLIGGGGCFSLSSDEDKKLYMKLFSTTLS